MRRALFVRTGICLLAAAFMAASCSGDKAPRRGQIMVALQTDMSIPKDVTKIYLRVTVRGEVKHANTYLVAPDGTTNLPATLAIVAGEEEAPPIQVLVVGLKADQARTLSKVVTTIPRDRIATLHVPIQWLCDGTARPIPGTDDYDTTCPALPNGNEASCVAGTCQDVNVPEPTLPTFSPPDVFGGGQGPNDFLGQCFDVTACFAGAMDVVPDADCRVTVTVPPAGELNFAVRTGAGGDGICDEENPDAPCFVVLDQDDKFGWHEPGEVTGRTGTVRDAGTAPEPDGGLPPDNPGGGSDGRYRTQQSGPEGTSKTVQLPPAVCDKIDAGMAEGVSVSTTCQTKTRRYPTCGPWSSVAGSPIAGVPPVDGDGGFAGCPGFPDAMDGVTDDPVIDRLFSDAAEILVASDQLKTRAFQHCANIVSALGGTAPTAPTPPADEDVTSACQAAEEALAADREASGAVLYTPGFCTAPTDEQSNCEAQCQRQSGCESDPFEVRCSEGGGSIAGRCDSTCSGQCLGTRDVPVECNGACQGVCNGTCTGTCTSPDGQQSTESCAGWCTGSCSGSCEGTCLQSSAACSEGCSGDGAGVEGGCATELIDPTCSMALAEDTCVDEACAALCAAEANMGRACVLTYSEFYGSASDGFRTAIDQNFGPLYDIGEQYGALSVALSRLAYGASLIATTHSDDLNLLDCISTASEALNSAALGLTSVVTAIQPVLDVMITPPTDDGGVTRNCPPGADPPCDECAKSACCDEHLACLASANCASEVECMLGCLSDGGTQMSCEEVCNASGTGTIEAVSSDLLACKQGPACAEACGQPVCMAAAGGDGTMCSLAVVGCSPLYLLECTEGGVCNCYVDDFPAASFATPPNHCDDPSSLEMSWTVDCGFPPLPTAPTPPDL